MIRGINKQNLFEDDEDRQRFIETIGYYKTISNYKLYGYCLMNNHVHILLQETGEPISRAIKRISSSYVYWYNQKYDRCGHLFQERFKSEVVETDPYFLVVLRYIHQNPVKAGITKDIGKYRWSSYQEYVGIPVIADVDFALNIYADDRKKAVNLFKAYTVDNTTDECLDYKENMSLSDQEIIKYLSDTGVASISELQRLEKSQRDDVIRRMKGLQGVTVRQLARITGISKSVIDRI